MINLQELSTEVASNHGNLEQLEKIGRELAHGFRSRESAGVKSRLATLRRQWESLCSRAKDESSTLSTSVTHWQAYVSYLQIIMPWLDEAERYLAQEAGRSLTLEEARAQYDQHQAFLREEEKHQDIFDQLTAEASHMTDRPEVSKETEELQKRWERMATASDDHNQVVLRALEAWTAYMEDVKEVEMIEHRLEERLQEEPKVYSTQPEVLSRELDTYKVSRKLFLLKPV